MLRIRSASGRPDRNSTCYFVNVLPKPLISRGIAKTEKTDELEKLLPRQRATRCTPVAWLPSREIDPHTR
jgi:hypothetical protein